MGNLVSLGACTCSSSGAMLLVAAASGDLATATEVRRKCCFYPELLLGIALGSPTLGNPGDRVTLCEPSKRTGGWHKACTDGLELLAQGFHMRSRMPTAQTRTSLCPYQR